MGERIEARFRLEYHDDFGEWGFRPAWMPDGDPRGGRAVAHDTLEHGGAGDDSIAAELRAVGAAYWLRWESGAVASQGLRTDAVENIASDFIDIYRHFEAEGFGVLDPAGRPDAEPIDDDDADDVFARAVASIRATLRAEDIDPTDDYVDADRFAEFSGPDYARRMLGWLRVGYRDALRRFDGVDAWSVYFEAFEPIANAVDGWLGTAEPETIGDAELVVTFDPDAFEWSARLDLGSIECFDCEGYGEAEGECPDCDGGALLENCPECHGYPDENAPDGHDTCPHCDGEGLDPCRECKGTGERVRECPTCEGECMVEHPESGELRLFTSAEIERIRRGY